MTPSHHNCRCSKMIFHLIQNFWSRSISTMGPWSISGLNDALQIWYHQSIISHDADIRDNTAHTYAAKYHEPEDKTEMLSFGQIFVIGCTGCCHNDNFWNSQWRKFLSKWHYHFCEYSAPYRRSIPWRNHHISYICYFSQASEFLKHWLPD